MPTLISVKMINAVRNQANPVRNLVIKDAGKRSLNEDFDTADEGLPNNGEFVLILRTRAFAQR